MDEGTARFSFLGAIGLTTLCAAGAFWLAVHSQMEGARLFLALALAGIAATLWFRRIYHRRRRVRWEQELKPSRAALDRLFQANRVTAPDPAQAEPEAGSPPTDTNAHT